MSDNTEPFVRATELAREGKADEAHGDIIDVVRSSPWPAS